MTALLLACCLLAARAAATPGDEPLSSTSPRPTLVTLRPDSLCDLDECSCRSSAHPSWTVVNCTLDYNQVLEISNGSVPSTAIELMIEGGREVHMGARAFTGTIDLQRVHIHGASLVRVRRHAFLNLTALSTRLDVYRCGCLYFDSKAFAHTKGPLHVNITLVEDVIVQRETFSWLLSFFISGVPRLELASGAFLLETRTVAVSSARHGPHTKIEMVNVLIPELPADTFGSSAAEVRMLGVEVLRVRTDAFSANTLGVVDARNSAFHVLEHGAFAQKTLIERLSLTDCHVHVAHTGAVLASTTNLTLQNSKFSELASGAINTTVATVTIMDNEFDNISSHAITLESWNRLRIERNSFGNMEPYAISAPLTLSLNAAPHELTFIENELIKLSEGSLQFIDDALKSMGYLELKYRNNYFAQVCHCDIDAWFSSLFGNSTLVTYFLEDSYCTVNTFFAKCFNVPEGNVQMKNFSSRVCGPGNDIICESVKQNAEGVTDVIKNTRFPQRTNQTDSLATALNDSKHIPVIILIVVSLCVVIIILTVSVAWIKRKGCSNRIRNAMRFSHSSYNSFLDKYFGFNGGVDRARSISRLSVGEYTERHRLNEIRTIDNEDRESTDMEIHELIQMDHKATQTLPEELTEELLENLREQLDDPENYTRAREMIEHLYELIKVEESCNNNPPALFDDNTENLYDIIQPTPTPLLIRKNNKTMVSVGTKVPSFEKLTTISPYYAKTALCHEYFEPKDLAMHLYDELVCNGDSKGFGNVPDLVAEQAPPRGPYLRAIRDKLNGSNQDEKSRPKAPKSRNESLERLPPYSSDRSLGKMSNRPLPRKPHDPGEGTSGLKM